MQGIQDAPAEEKDALFRDHFCRQSTKVKYEYELCSSSKSFTIEHKTKGKTQTRAFLKYDLGEGGGSETTMDIKANYDQIDAEGSKHYAYTVPQIECSETAEPSQFPVGIYDVNGSMKGENQQKVDRTYRGCWEHTSYKFPALDTPQIGDGGAKKEPCTEEASAKASLPAPTRTVNDMIQFTVPAIFKKSEKCSSEKEQGKKSSPSKAWTRKEVITKAWARKEVITKAWASSSSSSLIPR
jgi:hypothetical protein